MESSDGTDDESRSREKTTTVEAEHVKERKQERRMIFNAFKHGRLAKAFSRSTEKQQEQEVTGEGEGEGESDMREGVEEGEIDKCKEVDDKDIENSEVSGDQHTKREKGNLLKVFKLNKSFSKIDREDRPAASDGERWGSVERVDDGGGMEKEEGKGRWNVPGIGRLTKAFAKWEVEDEGKREEVEEGGCERGLSKKGKGESEGKVEAGEEDEMLGGECEDGSEEKATAVAGKQEAGAVKAPRFPGLKVLKPPKLTNIFSREKGKKESDRSRDGEGKGEMDIKEAGQEPAIGTQTNWRTRKTRKARRLTKGTKQRQSTGNEEQTEVEINEREICIEGGTERENEQDKAPDQSPLLKCKERDVAGGGETEKECNNKPREKMKGKEKVGSGSFSLLPPALKFWTNSKQEATLSPSIANDREKGNELPE